MNRRKFIAGAVAGLGAAYLTPGTLAEGLEAPAHTEKVEATDTVVLGKTGIRHQPSGHGHGHGRFRRFVEPDKGRRPDAPASYRLRSWADIL